MFEITDDFLAQAGFTSLNDEQKAALKQKVAESVQAKIGNRIVEQVGEEKAEELGELMDSDAQMAAAMAEKIDSNYQSSEDFKAIQGLGRANSASDEEIVREYAVITWMKHHGVDIGGVIQDSMNDALEELSAVYQAASQASGEQEGS